MKHYQSSSVFLDEQAQSCDLIKSVPSGEDPGLQLWFRDCEYAFWQTTRPCEHSADWAIVWDRSMAGMIRMENIFSYYWGLECDFMLFIVVIYQ